MGYCDSCSRKTSTRRIETGGGSGINLCNPCLRKEIAWRKLRNKDLTGKAKYRTKYKL